MNNLFLQMIVMIGTDHGGKEGGIYGTVPKSYSASELLEVLLVPLSAPAGSSS